MTDIREPEALEIEIDDAVVELIEEPLWRVRFRLFRKSFLKNWALFKANKIGMVGLVIIAIFGLMAMLQPILVGGFTVFSAIVVLLVSVAFLSIIRSIALSALPKNNRGVLAANVIAGILAIALTAFLVAINGAWPSSVYDPVIGYESNPPSAEMELVFEVTDPATQASLFEAQLLNPTLQEGQIVTIDEQPAAPYSRHLLGTDPLGRDILSQLMFGARAAFLLGIVAALVTVFIATTVGAVSAFYGGVIDSFFMRLADLLLMLPFLAVLIALSGVFLDFKLWHLAMVLGILSGFGGTAIILKSQALAVKVKPFVDAARVAGGSNRRIIFTHLVPNVIPMSFLYMMFTVTAAIAIEATLSWLGLLNVDMSWGLMIQLADNQGYMLQGLTYWWLLFPAGLAVTLLAMAFYLVGRGMDEIINPRLRQR